ncbi:hypothetical protein BDB01DRAFT_706087, partial [Pilobolus umbonatus]
RVSIIGAGTLGGTVAYSLILKRLAKEILLIDMSNNILQGQVLDLSDASEGTDIVVRAGTFKEAGQSSLVVFTADTTVVPGETHAEWIQRSRLLLVSIASSMISINPNVLFLVLSNPVDLYVQSLQVFFSELSSSQIFGIGNALSTKKFKSWLSQIAIISDANTMVNTTAPTLNEITDAYCIGTLMYPVIVWSYAKINGIKLPLIPNVANQKLIADKLVSTGRTTLIFEKKGYAWYGMVAMATELIETLCNQDTDKHEVFVLSVFVNQFNTCMSWPVKIGVKGIVEVNELPLSEDE